MFITDKATQERLQKAGIPMPKFSQPVYAQFDERLEPINKPAKAVMINDAQAWKLIQEKTKLFDRLQHQKAKVPLNAPLSRFGGNRDFDYELFENYFGKLQDLKARPIIVKNGNGSSMIEDYSSLLEFLVGASGDPMLFQMPFDEWKTAEMTALPKLNKKPMSVQGKVVENGILRNTISRENPNYKNITDACAAILEFTGASYATIELRYSEDNHVITDVDTRLRLEDMPAIEAYANRLIGQLKKK